VTTGALAVRISGVSHRYGTVTAVADFDLTIAPGSSVGFIGPDGVGKSTLLALIAGAKRLQTGTLDVLGGSIADRRHRAAACPRIAYMPQGLGRNLYPTLTAAENVDFFGRLFGQSRRERRRRAADLFTATGLAPFADRPVGKLSGGMKQKLGLCCALIHDPELLILDEPTTGVDPLSRRQFWELIANIRAGRPGMSLLVATAYMEEAERFDQLVVMDTGRALATGTPAEVKARAGTATLDEAFIALLPAEKRRGHQAVVIPPRAAASGPPAIEARGLTRRFGSFTAVDNVSFRIERGEIFGFLGSNGCGKTTTMKMLTGLLPATAGEVELLGKPVDATDLATRRRVGYMSQAFSLYTELTVRQNLELNARLFGMTATDVDRRVSAMLDRFELRAVADVRPDALPLGVRQRLSLAVALVHGPEVLILDEPTSGVDPVARDGFWAALVELSRRDGVTIFVSTHFMNEARRCDRISLMHAGQVLAVGTPDELAQSRNAADLEEAFIRYLEEAGGVGTVPTATTLSVPLGTSATAPPARFSPRRLWAYARREATEIHRDPIRLAFALVAPLILMVAFSYGISFDVEDLPYAVLDHDQSIESREYLDGFAASRYFRQQRPLADHAELETRLRSGELKFAIEVPPGFGRDLRRGRQPEVGVWVDGSMPFRADTCRSYAEGVHQAYLNALTRSDPGRWGQRPPIDLAVRFRYNQDFRSVYAIVPGVIMLLLMLIPAMMTAVGVVREKEIGSIINLYVTPVTGIEYLLGKQLPYIGLAFVSFVTLAVVGVLGIGVPIKGSGSALLTAAALYVGAATGFGLVVSSFVRTQVAAVFAAGILSVVPVVQFSGLLTPVSSLSGGGRVMSALFPSTYFQHAAIGSFTKGLGFGDLTADLLALAGFAVGYLAVARALLPTQEE
jgi:ribosome-dependent ATPase